MVSRCPALLVGATSSGTGKTSIVAALARLHSRQGRKVQVFKCGPDFLDPQIHQIASGQPVYSLDLGMCGAEDAAWRLSQAAAQNDLILVEGVMGLYDGVPSTADIACRFNLPVLAVIDARAMAHTFGAMALGLKSFRSGLPFAGVLANRVGSARHSSLLAESLPAGILYYGALPRLDDATLPSRHLGLWQAAEIPDLLVRLDALADHLAQTRAAELPPPTELAEAIAPELPPLLAGRRIAIARDAAFGFLYPANIDTLNALGAELAFFSPLAGDALPACDALWLPGGYPELHLPALTANLPFADGLAAHLDANKPLLAECGGMMGLFTAVTDKTGVRHAAFGLLAGEVIMQTRPAALGTQIATLPEGVLRGHTFHYSTTQTGLPVLSQAKTLDGRSGEAIYRQGQLTASYVHFYFPSNPLATARLFGANPD